MDQSLHMLMLSALVLGFVHTVSGPDHYLPFVAMAKTRSWSTAKTIWVVSICGFGHVFGSIVIGLTGIAAGAAIGKIEFFEGVRGSLASWLLFTAGVVYTIWAIIHRIKNPHHKHHHLGDRASTKKTMTFWVLFTIFVFGPCEPLIPILMYPAAEMDVTAIVLVSLLFALTTISTMIATTLLVLKGFSFIKLHKLESYQHILAGFTLLFSGAGIIFLGL